MSLTRLVFASMALFSMPVVAKQAVIDPSFAALGDALRSVPQQNVNKSSARTETLIEHSERESDGARLFVLRQASRAYPDLSERIAFAQDARAALNQLMVGVPDRRAQVRAAIANAEFVVFNNARQDGTSVALFLRAPDWVALSAGASHKKTALVCPVNVSFPDGNGQVAEWVGQKAAATGQAAGNNGLYYEFEIRWIVTEGAVGTKIWTPNGGRCTQIDNPVPTTGGNNSTGNTSGGGRESGRSGGAVIPLGGGIPSSYYLPPVSYTCGPDPNTPTSVVCAVN